MKVLVYKPGLQAEVVETENSLEQLQKIVGGKLETMSVKWIW